MQTYPFGCGDWDGARPLLAKRQNATIIYVMGQYADMVTGAINECGLSRYELAKRTGVSEAALSRIVRGERRMTLETLDRLAAEIGIELRRVKVRRRKEK